MMATMTTKIKKLGINGEGVAYKDRKIIFVPGALPNEEVEIQILKDEPKYKLGKLIKVIEPSTARIKSKCTTQKNCLGCPLMIMDYQAQIESKKELLDETFKRYVPNMYQSEMLTEVIPAPQQTGIRNIVRLPVVRKHDQTTFGIYQRESKYLTLMTDCLMQSKRINAILKQLVVLMNQFEMKPYDEELRKGVRFLTVREFDEGVQLIFVTGLDRLPEPFMEALKSIDDIVSVYLTINTARKQDFDLQKYELKYGKSTMTQIFMQKPFRISAKADFPVYRQQALRLAKRISSTVDALPNVQRIIDIGCGVGLYSLGLNDRYEIKGIDISKIAINDAIASKDLQQRENASFEDGRVEKLFTTLSKKQPYDLVMLHLDHMKMTDELIYSIKQSKTKYILIESNHLAQVAKVTNELMSHYAISEIVGVDHNPNGPSLTALVVLTFKK